MAKAGHRDIPGLPGGAGWCVPCEDYCGGEQGACVCCGGEMSAARRGSLPPAPEPARAEVPAAKPMKNQGAVR